MNTNGVKSYADSYLYNKIPNYERNILEFVMKSERINKQSESFTGIIEDIKRRQSSAVLSRVLMREDVVLCIHTKPLPASFKVFACKDVKNDRTVKVFIDCTGLVSLKNGYFVCREIDKLCTRLFAAMTYIVYNNETMRITNNSTVVSAGTDCFVSLASHIFDYLRVNGFSENRAKIGYILAMYFQVHLLGLNRSDASTKNLAAKISGVANRDINAMEIYYADEDFNNIDTLITSIANTFKMKGMSTDIFVEKWIWFYGTGTQFGCELFTAFSEIITDAYCGSYVNNQKSIEKCCGRSMVEYSTAIMRIGEDAIDNGFRYESSMDREDTKNRFVVQEVLFNKRITKEMQITVDDLKNPSVLIKKINVLAKEGYGSDRERSKGLKSIYLSAIGTTQAEYLSGKEKGYNKMISTTVKAIHKHLLTKEKEYVINGLRNSIIGLKKAIDNNDNVNSETKKVLEDCKVALKIIDPDNSLLDESASELPENTESVETLNKEYKESGLLNLFDPDKK